MTPKTTTPAKTPRASGASGARGTAPAAGGSRAPRFPGNALSALTRRSWPLQAVGLGVVLTGWQVVGAFTRDVLSQPTRVAGEIVRLFREEDLLGLLLGTVGSLLAGWVISVVVGVLVGFMIGRFRLVAVALEPYLVALYAVPLIALVPLLVIWFGVAQKFLIATVIMATAIMLVFPAAAGTREAMREYEQVARAYCVSGWRLFVKVLLPGSLPFIASGMRISVQRALIAVTVGQFLVGHAGLGTLLSDARARLDADEVFAVAVVAMAVGIVLTTIVGAADRRLSRWRTG